MKHPTALDASRREFLRRAGMFSAIAGPAAPLAINLAAMGSAAAQTAGDYKALVCLFLFGGNDTYNMVLPTDAASWGNYTTTRNQAPDSIALLTAGTPADLTAAVGSPARLGGVLPISAARPQSRSFALHPLMGSLQTMFNADKRLAIVPNIGPLITPTTKAQYTSRSVPLPQRLYSHNDQQNTWQALGPEGTTLGWGGRMGDMLAGSNARPVFTAVSAAGNAVFLSGNVIRQYQVGTNGAIRLGADSSGRVYALTLSGVSARSSMKAVFRGAGYRPADGSISAGGTGSPSCPSRTTAAARPLMPKPMPARNSRRFENTLSGVASASLRFQLRGFLMVIEMSSGRNRRENQGSN